MISLVLVAGGETTGPGIANPWATLVAHPDALDALRADPGRMDQVISEAALRFDPDRPDLHLGKESRPARQDPDGRWGHLTFGAGDHICVGYQLARPEMEPATTTLLDRYGSVGAVEPLTFRIGLALMRRVDRLALDVGSRP